MDTFYRKRTHDRPKEHILHSENTFYTQRTHSTLREHILYTWVHAAEEAGALTLLVRAGDKGH